MTQIIGLEVQFFLTSIFYGIVLLLVYDCLRVLRRVVKHNALFVALEDIIFWIAASIVIFMMIYEKNNGTIRAYAILGMLLGMIIYNQLVSKILIKGITWLINKVVHLIGRVFSFLFRPFVFIGKKVGKRVHAVKGKISGAKNNIKRKSQKASKKSTKQLKSIAKTVKIAVKKK